MDLESNSSHHVLENIQIILLNFNLLSYIYIYITIIVKNNSNKTFHPIFDKKSFLSLLKKKEMPQLISEN